MAAKLQPNDPYTHANLGHVLFEDSRLETDPARKARKVDEAAEHARLAIEQRPILPEPHNTLGRIYWERGELDQAAAEFREALTYDAGLMAAHENLAKLLMALQKWDEAQEEVREMLKTNPK